MSSRTLIWSGLLCWTTLSAPAAQPFAVQVLLQHAILASNAPMSEVQSFTESRIPLMPPVRNLAEWEQQARQIRQNVFDQVIFRGAAAG